MGIKSKSQLERAIIAKMQNALFYEVAEEVRMTQQASIEEDVYGAYNPNPDWGYERRRYNGGLISSENIIHMPYYRNENTVGIEVRNVTTMTNDPNQYLTPLIVLGHYESYTRGIGDRSSFFGGGYSEFPSFWMGGNTDANYAGKRDFIGATKYDLNRGGYHKKAMKQGLRRQGVKLK